MVAAAAMSSMRPASVTAAATRPAARKRQCRAGVVCLVLLLASLPSALAQQAPAAPISPAAQEAEQKGIVAANSQNYLQAIQYFQDARSAGSSAPDLFFNLGLAESKIPGRELRAISWFAAYLAAIPDAPNATAVQQQINVLDARSKGNLARLVQSVQDAAEKIPNRPGNSLLPDGGYISLINQDRNFERVAELWVSVGDASRFMRIGTGLTDDTKLDLAKALASAKFFKESKSLLAGVKCDVSTDSSLSIADTANDTALGGDADDAREILQRCDNTMDTALAWARVAEAQFKKGDADGARASLVRALNSTHRFVFGNDTSYSEVACLQANMGDFADADKTIALMREYKPAADTGGARSMTAVSEGEQCVAKAHLDHGDIAGARAAVAQMPPPPTGDNDRSTYDGFRWSIARTQLIHGDRAGAQETAAPITTAIYHDLFRRTFDSSASDPDYFKQKPQPSFARG